MVPNDSPDDGAPADHDAPEGRGRQEGPSGPDRDLTGDESRAEELYDLYLEQALEGGTGEPGEFLAECGVAPGALHDELIDRLRQIRDLAGDSRAARPAAEGLPFERLGDFRLLERLDEGAMGVVYLAEQTSLGRLVALKILREELSGTADAQQRFEREARALASIEHPGVVRLYGFGRDQGVRYLAMELVPGESVAERIERSGRLPAAEVARLGVELAEACARVHGVGLLHRDIKPSNVRVDADGHAVLLDFGLARGVGLDSERRTAGFVGSLGYAAPEQVRGNLELDERADVYSIGATLWHALAGRPPFRGRRIEPLLHAILAGDVPPLRRLVPSVPADLATVVERAMERDPRRRYASAHDLAADLEAVLALRPIAARPPGPVGVVSKWTRRNPVAAGAGTIAALALGSLVALVLLQGARERAGIRSRATQALAEARAAIDRYRSEREAMAELDREVSGLAIEVEFGHMLDARRRRYWELVDNVAAARRSRAGTGFVVADALSRAVRLAPELVDEALHVRRDLLREQWKDAASGGRVDELRLLEQELRALEASSAEPLLPELPVAFELAPGARAWGFRLRELSDLDSGRGYRQVPVPIDLQAASEGAESPPGPGDWALRPAREGGGFGVLDRLLSVHGHRIEGGPFVRAVREGSSLRVGDRLVSVRGEPARDPIGAALLFANEFGLHEIQALPDDGLVFERDGRRLEASAADLAGAELWTVAERLRAEGGPAVVLRDGRRQRLVVPPGLEWRTSAFVLAPLATNAIETSSTLALAPGQYVFLVHAEGCEPLRAHVRVQPGHSPYRLDLAPRPHGFAPPGFRHVVWVGGELWIAEFEVTVGEYLEFLDAPEVRRAVQVARGAGARGHVPKRVERTGEHDLVWPVDDDGATRLGPGVDPLLPVVGISKLDADAYVHWLNARSDSEWPGRFALGAEGSRVSAGVHGPDRSFSYGSRFDPQAANTCFSRPVADIEPVGSYPLDESPMGVYDLCGNAAELIDSYFDRARRAWHGVGGSWAQAPGAMNQILGGFGHAVDEPSAETGMRLIWIPEDGPR